MADNFRAGYYVVAESLSPLISTHMKKLLFFTMIVVPALAGYSQQNEFPVYTNGLVYSDTTMQQLKFIVDSLNLKFKRCDPDRKYYSIKQGLANRINLYKANSKPALADILNGISYAGFIHKYKSADIDTSILLTESDETDYKNNRIFFTRYAQARDAA